MLTIRPLLMRSAVDAAWERKQRRLEVGPDEVVPIDLGNITHRCRVEGRRVVDENIERSKVACCDRRQRLQLIQIEQIGLDQHDGIGSYLIQLSRQRLRRFRGAAIVQNNIRPRRMQLACDGGSHPACSTCYQRSFAGQRAMRIL